MKRVVVFGVFDLLHPGHLYFLEQAKKQGTHLIAVVTRNARVIAEKKHKPFFHERERLKMVSAVKWVNRAVLGDRVGEWKVIKQLRPDVICLGYDQGKNWLKRCKLQYQPQIVHIKSYYKQRYSSTALKKHLSHYARAKFLHRDSVIVGSELYKIQYAKAQYDTNKCKNLGGYA